MKRFYRKLKSERGASMVFALLVFMMCVLAGTVALTAASANAGRYTHLEEEQRQYFSVASALELLQSQLDKRLDDPAEDPVRVVVKCVETETLSAPASSKTVEYTPMKTASGGPGEELKEPNYYQYLLVQNCLPEEALENIQLSHPSWRWGSSPASPKKNYTIELNTTTPGSDPPSWSDFLYPVSVTVKGSDDGSYTLEMRLQTKDTGAHPIKVVWSGEVVTDTETTTDTTGTATAGTRTTTTTYTYTLRWSAENRMVTFE